MLLVSKVAQLEPRVESGVQVDAYVPLKVETSPYGESLSYLLLGDGKHTRLELKVQLHHTFVRSFILVAMPPLSPWPKLAVREQQEGLPVFERAFDEREVVDLRRDFEVAVQDDDVLIFWDDVSDCTAAVMGRVQFLIGQRRLVVLVTSLTQEQMSEFMEHTRRAKRAILR